jgi:hypothetical protein
MHRNKSISLDCLVGTQQIDGGMVSPSDLAVLTLTNSSNLIGACTGRSVGFSPLSGGLTSYGVDRRDQYQRAAEYVSGILEWRDGGAYGTSQRHLTLAC